MFAIYLILDFAGGWSAMVEKKYDYKNVYSVNREECKNKQKKVYTKNIHSIYLLSLILVINVYK